MPAECRNQSPQLRHLLPLLHHQALELGMRKTVKSCGRQTAAHAGSARRLCVVGLEDGRVLIKKVQPSRDLDARGNAPASIIDRSPRSHRPNTSRNFCILRSCSHAVHIAPLLLRGIKPDNSCAT